MRKNSKSPLDDVSLVLCGEAGQGIKTVERILTRILKRAGYHVFACSEFMSRIRGGSNSTTIRVSTRRRAAPLKRIDFCVPFHAEALKHLASRLSAESVILGDRRILGRDPSGEPWRVINVPFGGIAEEVGGPLFLNMVAVGVVTGLFALDPRKLTVVLRRYFAEKDSEMIEKNIAAADKGFSEGSPIAVRSRAFQTRANSHGLRNHG